MGPSPFVIVVVSALVRPPLVRGQEVGPHQTECPTDKRPPVPAVPGENLKTRLCLSVQDKQRGRAVTSPSEDTKSRPITSISIKCFFGALHTYSVWGMGVFRPEELGQRGWGHCIRGLWTSAGAMQGRAALALARPARRRPLPTSLIVRAASPKVAKATVAGMAAQEHPAWEGLQACRRAGEALGSSLGPAGSLMVRLLPRMVAQPLPERLT